MRFVNEPVRKEASEYQRAIEGLAGRLSDLDEVVSVYQVGGLSAPGISDVDLVVIFKDDVSVHFDPLDSIAADEKYFYVHALFGASQSGFAAAQQVSLFHNYRHLAGQECNVEIPKRDASDLKSLQQQIALEYLLRMVINLTLDHRYRIFNVRNLLLQTHAVKYDLLFLDIDGGSLAEQVDRVIQWRRNWFDGRPGKVELRQWFAEFKNALVAELDKQLQTRKFYLPNRDRFRMGRNIDIARGDRLQIHARGIRLPTALAAVTSRYARIQNRFNSFEFEVPYRSDPPEIIARLFELNRELRRYNERMLPRFMALTSSLVLN